MISDVTEPNVFSLVNETADIAVRVRNTKKEESNYVSKEDFLGFVIQLCLHHITGQDIAKSIISYLKNLDLDSKMMVAQDYDDDSVMKESFKGLQALIINVYPEALYVHTR